MAKRAKRAKRQTQAQARAQAKAKAEAKTQAKKAQPPKRPPPPEKKIERKQLSPAKQEAIARLVGQLNRVKHEQGMKSALSELKKIVKKAPSQKRQMSSVLSELKTKVKKAPATKKIVAVKGFTRSIKAQSVKVKGYTKRM